MKTLNKFVMCMALTGAMTVATTASADVVTQLIHFDDASNGWKWYSDADFNFLFDPTNFQSSTQCAEPTDGQANGNCLIEGNQGVLPLMTRPVVQTTSQGSASPQDLPGASGTQAFTLDSFYFLLTGNGEGAENAITATDNNGNTYTFQLGGNYDAAGAPDVRFYEGANAGQLAGDLVKNTGYIVTFGDLFKDVLSIQFSAPRTAQVRLDCVVATFDGTTTQPANGVCGLGTGDDDEGGGDDDNSVPEPALLSLFGAGLAAAAYKARRRS